MDVLVVTTPADKNDDVHQIGLLLYHRRSVTGDLPIRCFKQRGPAKQHICVASDYIAKTKTKV
jgi:hypothetical protein